MNRLVRTHDPDLYVKRAGNGTLCVMKRRVSWESYEFAGALLHYSRIFDDLVLPLTDDWQATGQPVEWGMEPVYWKLQELDGHRDDTGYDKFVKEREQKRANKDRAFKNEVRARAYDLRKDFARATNDINTSTLDKIDKRRKYDGHRR